MFFPGKSPSQNRTPFLISSMAKLSAMRETINVEDKKEGGGGDAEDRTGLSGNTGGSDNKTRARRSKSKDDGKQKKAVRCAAEIRRKDCTTVRLTKNKSGMKKEKKLRSLHRRKERKGVSECSWVCAWLPLFLLRRILHHLTQKKGYHLF